MNKKTYVNDITDLYLYSFLPVYTTDTSSVTRYYS